MKLSALRFVATTVVLWAPLVLGDKIHDSAKKLRVWEEECQALIGVGQKAGAVNQEANETYFLACGTNDGLSYNVEGGCKSWIDNRVFMAQLYSNKTELEMGETWINLDNHHLEQAYFPPGLKNSGAMANATPAVGRRSVLAVIVRLEDAYPIITEDRLKDSLFGTDGDDRTLKSLYAGCSRGQLDMVPSDDRTGPVNPIAGGVTTLYIPKTLSSGENVIRNTITARLKEEYGVSSPQELADHVMYCLPEGVMPLASWSFVHNWLSVYTDTYCTHATFQSHEIAHNLNLADSGKFKDYDDHTGIMGVRTDTSTEPLACFNGAKLYQLGWYEESTEIIKFLKSSPPTTVTLHGFVKDASTAGIKIVKLDRRSPYDFYLVFNWPSGPNAETPRPNVVTVTGTGRHGQSYYESTNIANLGEGDVFVQEDYFAGPCNLMIHVTEINPAEGYAVLNLESCFDSAQAAADAAAEIELQNKIRAYEEAVAAKKKQQEDIANRERSGMPIAPYVPISIPPAPPHPPYTPKPIGPTPAPTPRPTYAPTTSCVELGGLCFDYKDCCHFGLGECREESYGGGATYMLKCREPVDVNATKLTAEEIEELETLAEDASIYGESLLGLYGGTCNKDGICTDGEHCLNCPTDCSGNLVGAKKDRYCCHGDAVSDVQFGARGDDPRCTCDRMTPRDATGCNGYVTGRGNLPLSNKAYLRRRDCPCNAENGICPECNALDLSNPPVATFEFDAKRFTRSMNGYTIFDIYGINFHFRTISSNFHDGLEAVCSDTPYESGYGVLARWSGYGKIAWNTGRRELQKLQYEEGYRFFAAVQDNGGPGSRDTLRLRIFDDNNELVFDTNPDYGHIFDIDPFCGTSFDECIGDPVFPDFGGDFLAGANSDTGGNGDIQVHCTGGPGNAPCEPLIPEGLYPPTKAPTVAPLEREYPVHAAWDCVMYHEQDFSKGMGKWKDGGLYMKRANSTAQLKGTGSGAYIRLVLPLEDLGETGPRTVVKLSYGFWVENSGDGDSLQLQYARDKDGGKIALNTIDEYFHGIDFGGDTGVGTTKTSQIERHVTFAMPHSQADFLDIRIVNNMNGRERITYIDYTRVDLCVPPPVDRPELCPAVSLDFSSLTPGSYVQDLGNGVTVTAIANNGHTPDTNGVHQASGGAARVFDTLHPTGKDGQALCSADEGDESLGSPNSECPESGPGVGSGGGPTLLDETENPYANCDPQGNALIIQDSDTECPIDSNAGGTLVFDFDTNVRFRRAKFLNVVNGKTPEMTLTSSEFGYGRKSITKVVGTGANGLGTEEQVVDNVSQISVKFNGPGSISELGFEACPGGTPVPTNPLPTFPPTKEPTQTPTEAVFVGEGCKSKQLDVCLAIDLSGSICSPADQIQLCTDCFYTCHDSRYSVEKCCSNLNNQMKFSRKFIGATGNFVGDSPRRFSVVSFATDATVVMPLDTGNKATKAINAIPYSGGWTNTGDAIHACQDTLVNSDSVKVMVLLTDGTPTRGDPNKGNGGHQEHKDYATAEANAAKAAGTTIVPVVINSGSSDFSYLGTLGSDPEGEMLTVKNFNSFDVILNSLLKTINGACES
uniref:VWFA domain-containing protein n=1 Tax=Entomoneis paludosa TaxID=265537 RepID=A0A7S2YG23_9STRA